MQHVCACVDCAYIHQFVMVRSMQAECLALLKPVPLRLVQNSFVVHFACHRAISDLSKSGRARAVKKACMHDLTRHRFGARTIRPHRPLCVYIYIHIDIIYIHIKCRCMVLHGMSIPEISPI